MTAKKKPNKSKRRAAREPSPLQSKPEEPEMVPSEQGKTNDNDCQADGPSVSTENERSGSVSNPDLFLPSIPSLSRIMSVVVLVLGILGVGLLFYRVMAGFFVPLFLAALLVVIFRPVHEWILQKSKDRHRVAAGATTTLIAMIVLLPILLLLSVAAGQLTSLLRRVDAGGLQTAFERGRSQMGLTVSHPEHFRRLNQIADELQSIQPSDLKPTDLLHGADLVRFLQNDDQINGVYQSNASLLADSTLASLDRLIAQVNQQEANDSSSQSSQSFADQISDREKLGKQAEETSRNLHEWMQTILGGSVWGPLRLATNLSDSDYGELTGRIRESLQSKFLQITSRTGSLLMTLGIGMMIMVISLYFFLIDGPAMIKTLMRLSPLDDSYERQLLLEFDRTSRAVVLASVLSALAQGVLAAIAFYFLGFHSVVLLFFATSVMALVPFLGAASIWVPCMIWLAAVERSTGQAIFLLIYGALVISSIDNVIKVFVLHGRSQLHPLLALLSVLGGVSVFGPIGILVGPMVVVFLQTLLEILNHELESASEPDTSQAVAIPSDP